MIEATEIIYALGFMAFGFIGFCALLERREADILLLAPVWPILYIKYVWKTLR